MIALEISLGTESSIEFEDYLNGVSFLLCC